MVLFNAGVRAVFESHLERMPTDIEARWRDLIAGGARSEAFGPLTLQERLDERQVETALVAGRRQRVVNLFVTLVLIVGVAVGASWGWQEFGPGEDRTRGALQFAGTDEPADVAAIEGGPPVAEPALSTTLSDPVSVLAAAVLSPIGSRRRRSCDFRTHRARSERRSSSARTRAMSPSSARPGSPTTHACGSGRHRGTSSADTVTHGPCVETIGRDATVGCIGDTAILLALDIPTGEVALPEGGTGFADAIRLQLVADGAPDYEVLTVRGTIEVDPDSDIVIPRFGGQIGETIMFDTGAGRSGTCNLTGDFPRRP